MSTLRMGGKRRRKRWKREAKDQRIFEQKRRPLEMRLKVFAHEAVFSRRKREREKKGEREEKESAKFTRDATKRTGQLTASSMITTLFPRRSARPRLINCLCPLEKLRSPAETAESRVITTFFSSRTGLAEIESGREGSS